MVICQLDFMDTSFVAGGKKWKSITEQCHLRWWGFNDGEPSSHLSTNPRDKGPPTVRGNAEGINSTFSVCVHVWVCWRQLSAGRGCKWEAKEKRKGEEVRKKQRKREDTRRQSVNYLFCIFPLCTRITVRWLKRQGGVWRAGRWGGIERCRGKCLARRGGKRQMADRRAKDRQRWRWGDVKEH